MKSVLAVAALSIALIGCQTTNNTFDTAVDGQAGYDFDFNLEVMKSSESSYEFTNAAGDIIQYYAVKPNLSKSGEVQLYFYYEQGGDMHACSTEDDTTVAYKINGQNVQMFQWCKPYRNSSKRYLYAVPRTEKGRAYVDNEFATNTVVWVEYANGANVSFKTKGYEKAIRLSGGDAI